MSIWPAPCPVLDVSKVIVGQAVMVKELGYRFQAKKICSFCSVVWVGPFEPECIGVIEIKA